MEGDLYRPGNDSTDFSGLDQPDQMNGFQRHQGLDRDLPEPYVEQQPIINEPGLGEGNLQLKASQELDPAVVITPFEVFNKTKKASKPDARLQPQLPVRLAEPESGKQDEDTIFEGVVKNAKSSLQRERGKTSSKRPTDIDDELKGIDAGKVKKTASVYSESKEKSDQAKLSNLPPSRKIAQLFKAEFK